MASFVRRNLLTLLTIVGVVGGAALGALLRQFSGDGGESGQWDKRSVMYVSFPGEIFLRMLKCLIIPLLVTSVVTAIGSLDVSLSKKIAFRAIGYYSTTTVCAVVLGIVLVTTIRPGVGLKPTEDGAKDLKVRHVTTQDTLMDLIRNVFPPNLVGACIEQTQTTLKPSSNYSKALEDAGTVYDKSTWEFKQTSEDTTNVLGLVTFSIVLGIAIGKLGAKGKALLDFFDVLSESIMLITSWVIWLSPIGVFFLVAAKILEEKDFVDLIGRLGLYFGTVLLGLVIHGFGTLTVIYFITTRTLPFKIIGQLSQVLATAFGTASSSATMPITIRTMDEMGLDPRVTRFVIPIGATINMDGTALYEAVAAIFIAQIRGIHMSLGRLVAVSVTATAASVGAAGIPQAGLVTMVMVLDTVGLPSKEVINIIAVDWLLDRFRTTINVMCDCLGARLVDLLSVDEVQRFNDQDKLNADPHELIEMTKDSRI